MGKCLPLRVAISKCVLKDKHLVMEKGGVMLTDLFRFIKGSHMQRKKGTHAKQVVNAIENS